MTAQVSLYDTTTIEALPWPNSEVATLAKNYWVPLMKAGSSQFIDNVNSQLLALTIDNLVLPITVNHRELENSYVCSPYSHYITYSKEELYTLKNPPLENLLKLLLNFMGVVLDLGAINQVVIVNNWLLSTNLYPDLSKNQIAAITSYLKERFPTHTIIFRSINTFINDDLFNAFQPNGYQMIGSRQIYLFNPKNQSSMRTKMRWRLKQDFNLIDQEGYEFIDYNQISLAEVPRLVALYNALYLEKYSYNNPQFNE
ncbi:MAG TPA: GNAT family N-acetyltransferase, partial [Cyanophyceae cyanobacterium]